MKCDEPVEIVLSGEGSGVLTDIAYKETKINLPPKF
jgi:hypothetical protein